VPDGVVVSEAACNGTEMDTLRLVETTARLLVVVGSVAVLLWVRRESHRVGHVGHCWANDCISPSIYPRQSSWFIGPSPSELPTYEVRRSLESSLAVTLECGPPDDAGRAVGDSVQ
jgi:hypothetical protein